MPSGRAAWGYAMCMVAYQMVEEGVCRLGGSMGICYVYGSLPGG